MKYAKFNDDFLSYFRLDDNGETLVLTDKQGCTRAVKLLPHEEKLQGEWISVNERLPEINVDVIVTDIETTGTYSAYYLGGGLWECDNGPYNNRIIAWMPFPEPYMRGEEE